MTGTRSSRGVARAGHYRFVPAARYRQAVDELPMDELRAAATMTARQRIETGRQRLAAMLDHARTQVPAYASVPAGDVAERGLAAFPLVAKPALRDGARHLASGAAATRWNRTSGSTNAPLRTALGPGHEHNQILRWLRHWTAFGIGQPERMVYLIPRAYRIRVFGGGPLYDVAGGHVVHQRHPADAGAPPEHWVVVANPHVLGHLYPDGWPEAARLLVTSYEQRPTDLGRWPARAYGDVYGLSEVGDVAWQHPGDAGWELHDDLVYCEVVDARPSGDLVIGELAVTDLTNRVMPLVRYRTGDLVTATCDPDGRVRRLVGVAGRRILTRGTPLAGVDVMSSLVPSLLDLDEPFRVLAGADEVVVEVRAAPSTLARLTARLRRALPAVPIDVTDRVADPAGLREVFAPPEAPPPAMVAGLAECACAPTSARVVPIGAIRVCGSGAGGRRLMCLPPGPGLGHQIGRGLHPALAGLGSVRLVDYPGHGHGALPSDVGALVDDVAAALAGEDVLIGHSWGAIVALAVAARRRPAGLVLISPPPAHRWARHWTAETERMRRWRRDGLTGDAWYRRYLTECALPLGLRGSPVTGRALLDGVPTYESAWRRLRGDREPFDLRRGLIAAGLPALLVTGAWDPLLDREQVHPLGVVPGVSVVEIPGGHYPFLDCPDALREAVGMYLQSLEAGGR